MFVVFFFKQSTFFFLQDDLHGLRDTGYALLGDDEEEVGTGDEDTTVIGERGGVAVAVGADVVQGDTALVSVDRVGDTADADKDKACVCSAYVNLHGKRASDLDTLGAERGDGRTLGWGAILVEKVRWREDLTISVIDELVAVGGAASDSLGDIAETATAAEDTAISK